MKGVKNMSNKIMYDGKEFHRMSYEDDYSGVEKPLEFNDYTILCEADGNCFAAVKDDEWKFFSSVRKAMEYAILG